MDLGWLSDAWGQFQEGYDWWQSSGPGGGVSIPPATPAPGYAGGSGAPGAAFAIPSVLILAVIAVVVIMLTRKK